MEKDSIGVTILTQMGWGVFFFVFCWVFNLFCPFLYSFLSTPRLQGFQRAAAGVLILLHSRRRPDAHGWVGHQPEVPLLGMARSSLAASLFKRLKLKTPPATGVFTPSYFVGIDKSSLMKYGLQPTEEEFVSSGRSQQTPCPSVDVDIQLQHGLCQR